METDYNMKELEVLSEKDLEYFRKKEEDGTAVIIELPEEELIENQVD